MTLDLVHLDGSVSMVARPMVASLQTIEGVMQHGRRLTRSEAASDEHQQHPAKQVNENKQRASDLVPLLQVG